MERHTQHTRWHMRGYYLKDLSWDPSSLSSVEPATNGDYCRGTVGMEVTDGAYGDVSLSGLKWAVTYHWPGPVGEGHATAEPFLDHNVRPEQRDALLNLLSGRAGGRWFEVLASVTDVVLEPQSLPISFQLNMHDGSARTRMRGIDRSLPQAPVAHAAWADEALDRSPHPSPRATGSFESGAAITGD